MARVVVEDISAEAKYSDEYFANVRRRKDYLDVPQDWLERAAHPRARPLDYWEYTFHLLGDLGGGQKVLDLGCGSGWITRLLALKGASVTSADVSLEGCKATRERLQALSLPADFILVADAHRLPFRDGAFDSIVTIGVLHHLVIANVAPEVYRLLKPGGRAVGYEPLQYGRFMWALRKIWLKLNRQKEDEHTVNEAPLQDGDLAPFQRLFSRSLLRKMNFIAKTDRLKNRFGALADSLRWGDYLLLGAFPALCRFCTAVVFRFEK